MKRLLVIQSILLGITVALGVLTKLGVISGLHIVHGFIGVLSAITILATTIIFLRGKHSTLTKALSAATLLFVISALFAGRSMETTTDYILTYGTMAGSGIIAFIASIMLLRKAKS